MRLFKYLHPDRIDVLEKNLIRFTQPSALNDPFEMFIDIKPTTMDEIKLLFENSHSREIEQDIHSKDELFSEIKSIGIERFIKYVKKGYRSATNTLGILSLTTEENNLLMWAHYAYEHEGFVIEFNTESTFFEKKSSNEVITDEILKVNYESSSTQYTLDEIYNLKPNNAIELILKKGIAWKYEDEYRVIKSFIQAKKRLDNDIFLFDIDSFAIKNIYLGCRMKESTINRFKQLINNDHRYSHVSLFQATLGKNNFELEMIKL